jgi:hypothetical protein
MTSGECAGYTEQLCRSVLTLLLQHLTPATRTGTPVNTYQSNVIYHCSLTHLSYGMLLLFQELSSSTPHSTDHSILHTLTEYLSSSSPEDHYGTFHSVMLLNGDIADILKTFLAVIQSGTAELLWHCTHTNHHTKQHLKELHRFFSTHLSHRSLWSMELCVYLLRGLLAPLVTQGIDAPLVTDSNSQLLVVQKFLSANMIFSLETLKRWGALSKICAAMLPSAAYSQLFSKYDALHAFISSILLGYIYLSI